MKIEYPQCAFSNWRWTDRTPERTRAPEKVDRPQVGNENSNTPEAHAPIGGSERRPERTRPSWDSEPNTPSAPGGTRKMFQTIVLRKV